MGLYDESPLRRIPIRPIYVVLAILLILDIWLVLPPRISVSPDLSSFPVSPGKNAILWVTIRNNGSSPLTGGFIYVDSQSPFIEVNGKLFLPDVPAGGVLAEKIPLHVKNGAPSGDHLVRIFVSFPGRTDVVYYKVRVG